jgi:hypothetical protein
MGVTRRELVLCLVAIVKNVRFSNGLLGNCIGRRFYSWPLSLALIGVRMLGLRRTALSQQFEIVERDGESVIDLFGKHPTDYQQ